MSGWKQLKISVVKEKSCPIDFYTVYSVMVLMVYMHLFMHVNLIQDHRTVFCNFLQEYFHPDKHTTSISFLKEVLLSH